MVLLRAHEFGTMGRRIAHAANLGFGVLGLEPCKLLVQGLLPVIQGSGGDPKQQVGVGYSGTCARACRGVMC